MRRRIVVPRRAFALCLVLLAAACSRSKSNASDTGASAQSAPVATPSPAASRAAALAPANVPGALTKSIDQYSGEELYTFTHALNYGGGSEQDRQCEGESSCNGPNPAKKTKVRVDAVDGQDPLSVTAIPTDGVVTIRALNKGANEEARYKMKAGKKLEHYLIVLPGTGGEGRWRLEELDTTPKARQHRQIASGVLKGCDHTPNPTPTPAPVVRASFYTCQSAPHTRDSVQRSGLLLQASGSDPIWMYCSQTCCVANG